MFPLGKADMAFDAFLAARIRDALGRKKNIEEKKMFGGIGFMLNGNMMFGVWKDSLIARLDPDEGEEALLEPHVRGELAELGGGRVGREAIGRVLNTGGGRWFRPKQRRRGKMSRTVWWTRNRPGSGSGIRTATYCPVARTSKWIRR